MSNKLGYKTTNIGEIPEEWQVVRLSQAGRFLNGYAFKPSDWKKQGFPIIRIQNLNDSTTEFNYFDGTIDARYIVNDGDILLSWSASLGVYLWRRGKAFLNQHIFKVLPNYQVDKMYFYYILHKAIETLKKRVHGSTMRHFKKIELDNTAIPLPPLAEQQKIASILSCVDEATENTDKIIQKTQELKKGLMQQLLTKGIGHTKFKQTEIGEIPEEWLIISFGEICQNTQLGTAKRGLEGEKQVALIKMGNLTFGGLDLSDLEMVGYDGSELDQYKLKRGDFLFNTRNTPDLVGKTAVWNGRIQEAVFDNNIMRTHFKPEYVASSHMINYFLSSDLGRRWLRMRVHQTTSVAAIYWKQLKKILIPIPPLDEQKHIINILFSHDAKIENEIQKKAQLMKLKKGLMQDLLTGRVRVKVD